MKTVILITTILLLISCSQKAKQKEENFTNLTFLGSNDTLLLRSINAKCGEWGGDYQTIYVYKEHYKGKDIFLLDINECNMDCDSIEKYFYKPIEKSFEKKRINIDQRTLTLLSKAIEELIKLQMNFDADRGFSHSGCFSEMATSNKKLSLRIYPSLKWTTFEKLINFIKKERAII
jgi:hypothetical protein